MGNQMPRSIAHPPSQPAHLKYIGDRVKKERGDRTTTSPHQVFRRAIVVRKSIIERGDYTGSARGYDRYGLLFTTAIVLRISPDGSTIPLFYGEVKIDADNRYHPIPRTRPSEA
jgi:hypothetical protein